MPKLHTLTVPDLLWINFQITEQHERYDYARLEEAVFLQYGYGASNDLVGQAARLWRDFTRLRPFERGNAATGMLATLGFLAFNGLRRTGNVSELANLAQAVAAGEQDAADVIRQNTAESHDHGRFGVPETEEVLEEILRDTHEAWTALLASEPEGAIL